MAMIHPIIQVFCGNCDMPCYDATITQFDMGNLVQIRIPPHRCPAPDIKIAPLTDENERTQ